MTVREMHYDLKVKLNKVDSQQYRNLIVPEIDWFLNEAQEVFIKRMGQPRIKNGMGFESNQRLTDELRTIVREEVSVIPTVIEPDEVFEYDLPLDYMYFISARIRGFKNPCPDSWCKLNIKQHDDRHLKSPFDSPSFEWRTVNGIFHNDKLRVYTDGTFTLSAIKLTYLKQPVYIHNAQDFNGGQYNRLDGSTLTGFSNCELPDYTHRDIVDLAVLIATGSLQIPDFQIKLNKLQLNN